MKTTIKKILDDVADTYREAVKGSDKTGHAEFDTGNMAGFDNMDGVLTFDTNGKVIAANVSYTPKR